MTMITTIFITLLLLSGIFTILSKNPVHSVFYLILAFVASTLLLLLLKVEFIAMLFLVVYIGAISVLFLFVVMMLNIKVVELNEKILQYLPIGFFIVIIFFLEIYYMINNSLFQNQNSFLNLFWENTYSTILVELNLINFYEILDTFTNLTGLAFILYTKFIYLFIISGIILLVAMLGAILLTLNHAFISKRQDIFYQINREVTNSILLIN